jgi:glycosyltransferase involved in cell wall biosynthesis
MTPLVINWLVPEPFPGAGGDIGLFRLIRYLAEFGHDCRVYVVTYDLMKDLSSEEIGSYVRKHFGATPAQYHRFAGTIEDADATLATFWPTVENLLSLPNGGRRYYLVQDYEPSFYPDEPGHYARAENTYRAGLHCITLGPWLANLLRERYHDTADHFDFAVDKTVFYPRQVARDATRRVCFYARPTTPRRAYQMGLASLQIVKERLPEVEICLFGSPELRPVPTFPLKHCGILDEEGLAHLFSSSDVGIVLSLSNPSFVPLEMIACGCAVVEIESERWRGVLAHDENAWLVNANPTAIANGVMGLLTNDSARDRLIQNGLRLTQGMSWSASARQVESILLRDTEAGRNKSSETKLPSERFAPLRYGLGAWTEHIFFAYDLVAQLRPSLLVELGTDRGESYFAFCQSALENRTGTKCYAIDHWRGDPHAGSYDETTFLAVDAHNRAHYAVFSTLLRFTFDAAAERFEPESIDLMHIDGHHTQEAVRHDLETWLPKLRPGGILLLHDVTMRGRDFGVWKVWTELQEGGRSATFEQSPGLGIWEKPPPRTQPPLLEKLFTPGAAPAHAANESRTLRDYYRQCQARLQTKIARQWSDGTIRSSPIAEETVIQIFWSSDGSYSEEKSVDARLGHGEWKVVTMRLPVTEKITGLRIDFLSALTNIEIAEIAVESATGEMVYRANRANEFEAIRLLGDCERRSLEPFTIGVTGVDPQSHLPSLPPTPGPLLVRLRLCVTATEPE